MKILTLDIETAPNLAHTWGLWQQNVGLPQLITPGYVLCFAAKWHSEDDTVFHKGRGMVKAAHTLLNQADVVVGYNHNAFDLRWLHTEMVAKGMTPPSPYHSVDLLTVVRGRFKFPSNKLDYVAAQLLGERKAPTGGHATWIGCMANDPKAWAQMETYNRADVVLTERLFDRLKPWIKNLPNPKLYGDAELVQAPDVTCPQCGSANVKKAGVMYTQLSAYQRFLCKDCGRWSRGGRRHAGVDAR